MDERESLIRGALLLNGYTMSRLAEEAEVSPQLIARFISRGIPSPRAQMAIEDIIGPLENLLGRDPDDEDI
jgi:hypothetical protein